MAGQWGNNSAAPSCNSGSGLFSDRRGPKLNNPSPEGGFRGAGLGALMESGDKRFLLNGFVHLGNLRLQAGARPSPLRSRVLLSLGFPRCVLTYRNVISALIDTPRKCVNARALRICAGSCLIA